MITYDRVVVGAGIAGLLAAHRAVLRGERVLLLDAARTAGGALTPQCIGGVTVDAGAEAFSTVSPEMFTLLEEFGFADDIVTPNTTGAHLLTAHQQRYRIPHGVLGIPASLDDPELTALISPEALAQAHTLDAQALPDTQHLTVAQLVTARLGSEILEKLVEPVITAVHGSTAHRLPAQRVLAPVLTALPSTGSLCAAVARVRATHPRPGSAVASLRGGMHRLPPRVLQRLRSAGCATRFAADRIVLHRKARRWAVASRSEHWWARTLTVATGADPYSLMHSILPSELRAHPRDPSVDVALVFMNVESVELSREPLGTGALLAAGHPAHTKATTHVNAKWGWVQDQMAAHTHILRFSYGRNGVLPSQALHAAALADIASVYGVHDHRVRNMRQVRWPHTLSAPTPESSKRLAQLEQFAQHENIELCGPLFSGNGLLAIAREHTQKQCS